MENIIIERPEWDTTMRGRRARVWFYRRCSAWDLAARICGDAVTAAEYSAALKLLDQVQRYSIAYGREEELACSESYYNSAHHKRQERLLEAREERLKKALSRYGCRLFYPGLCPTIIEAETHRDLNLLHYFD